MHQKGEASEGGWSRALKGSPDTEMRASQRCECVHVTIPRPPLTRIHKKPRKREREREHSSLPRVTAFLCLHQSRRVPSIWRSLGGLNRLLLLLLLLPHFLIVNKPLFLPSSPPPPPPPPRPCELSSQTASFTLDEGIWNDALVVCSKGILLRCRAPLLARDTSSHVKETRCRSKRDPTQVKRPSTSQLPCARYRDD